MVLQIFSANSIGSGFRAEPSSNFTVYVVPGVTVASTDTTAIFATFGTSNIGVSVGGTVIGDGNGIHMYGTGHRVTVQAGGSVRGNIFTGIAMQATDGRVVNHGHVESMRSVGLYMTGAGTVSENFGTIASLASGIYARGVQLAGADDGVLRNFGSITAPGTDGIGVEILGTANALVENQGSISGRDLGLRGSNDADTVLNAGTISNGVDLGAGDDLFDGRGGRVFGEVLGGDGADTLRGGAHDDTLDGGAGNDLLIGGAGDDLLAGGAGLDTLRGGNGDDTLQGGAARDLLQGGPGDDLLAGGAGNDTLQGGAGDDTLQGGEGNDHLHGGAGEDILRGGAGRDTLAGGADADVFVFVGAAEIGTGGQSDRIVDFQRGEDLIDLSAFGGLDFIGNAGFSGTAGELRYGGAGQGLQGDLNGDGMADFRLLLTGIAALSAADLIL